MSEITGRRVGHHFISALMGFAMVWAFHMEYAPGSAANPYWLGGGILVGGALIVMEYRTRIGREISAVLENSMAITALVIVVGFVLFATVITVAELHFTPKWLSGILGLACSNLVVVPLYLSN
ncbi:hypothetical protein SAMN05421858_1868 [Haladaptatus litoreus]|uniref:Uncharacterized protein n=1 Tax=Haladaptatus litoreus TaxID=553468 RepID=A0A1N6Z4L1_9EURY|nr:hypothetical protein [Haladaptatus litoreus]SIR21760.1 hypothetical protein SAMN05421858_1868 [Haladaptatus litoreus]